MPPPGALWAIELDVVLAPARFPTQETALATHYYTTKEPVAATTPTVEALFGGKLTTLGPGTIGIPRGKANFDLTTGKQLFDLSHLLAHARDLEAVAAERARMQQVPWAERPHINIREFVTAVGPEALLYWDAVFEELAAP